MKPNRDYMEKPLPEWVSGSIQERFTRIYENSFWGEPDSASGPGSAREQTRTLVRELPLLFQRLGVRSVLDLPCGDFNWMREVDHCLDHYIGGDIVPALIEGNQARYGREGREFRLLDLTGDALPRVDLVLCRDVLVHLSYEDIGKALERVTASGSTWLLTTTFPDRTENRDIVSGDWRTLNLQLPPFNLSAPEVILNEDCPEPGYSDKSLGLWRIVSLPGAGTL